jgi:hypothetical protein
VIETFRALLLPLDSLPPPHMVLDVNYDAILLRSRRALARSVPACREAMSSIRDDLVQLGEQDHAATGSVPGPGLAGKAGPEGLPGTMRRDVALVAITPTKQEMRSSVGREVSSPWDLTEERL